MTYRNHRYRHKSSWFSLSGNEYIYIVSIIFNPTLLRTCMYFGTKWECEDLFIAVNAGLPAGGLWGISLSSRLHPFSGQPGLPWPPYQRRWEDELGGFRKASGKLKDIIYSSYQYWVSQNSLFFNICVYPVYKVGKEAFVYWSSCLLLVLIILTLPESKLCSDGCSSKRKSWAFVWTTCHAQWILNK